MPGLIDRTTIPSPVRESLRTLLAWLASALLSGAAFAADPQIASFTDTPDPAPAGGVVAYAVRVANNAVDVSQNTRLTFTLPTGAVFLSASPAGANCAALSANQVRCDLGTLAANGTDERDVTLRWRALGPGPTTLTATAVVSADNDANAGNNTQNQTTSVISGANLSLSKTDSPNPVVGGATIAHTLTAANAGSNASGDLVVTDNLPPSVAFVSAAGSGWTCGHAAGVVTCTRAGPHAVGAAVPAVTLVGTVNASGGTITNSASVAPAAGGVAEPDSADNTATADTVVLPGADLRMAQKTVTSALPATAGTDVSFRIEPRNAGPATAPGVVVTDPLPAGWTSVSASGPGWACSATGGSVGVAMLRDGADLRLSKSKTPNPVALNGLMTSTIAVANGGPRTATGPLRVVELLTGEVFVSASGSGWVCDGATAPRVVCNHPNTGGLAVGAALPTLSLVTRATSSGTVSNTACIGSSVPAWAGSTAAPPAEGDPNATNDCATASANSTTVQPDLAITKTTSTPMGGDKTVSTAEASVSYTLVVSNVSALPQAARSSWCRWCA